MNFASLAQETAEPLNCHHPQRATLLRNKGCSKRFMEGGANSKDKNHANRRTRRVAFREFDYIDNNSYRKGCVTKMNKYNEAIETLAQWYGKDTFLSLCTTDEKRGYIRVVNAYYEEGCFYVVTNTGSNKMRQIEKNPSVALSCGIPFQGFLNAHGTGENLGHVLAEKNTTLMATLREAFAKWYNEGDVNENDPNTCILCIRLAEAAFIGSEKDGYKGYTIDFAKMTADDGKVTGTMPSASWMASAAAQHTHETRGVKP